MQFSKLFVYGTLRKGFLRHRYLAGKTRFVSMGTITGTLYDLGIYPGVHLSGTGRITGEIYEIANDSDLLDDLDRIEGYNSSKPEKSLFVRTVVEATLSSGDVVDAWIYILPGKPAKGHIIPSGDYANG